MADEDEYDDGIYFDDDYFYVEDSYDRTDELAETSVPSPPPIDTIEDNYVSYDPYDYWLDVEYGTDEYYDVLLRTTSPENGTKRRRTSVEESETATKRRKIELERNIDPKTGQDRIWTGPNVISLPSEKLWQLKEPCKACGKLKPYALMPNWRTVLEKATLRNVPELQAPPDMDEDEDEDAIEEQLVEGDEAGSSCSEEDPRHDSAGALDLSQLMRILQEQTGGGDAAGIQQMLLQMLGEGGDAMDMDQLLEKLTSSVLNQVKEGGAASDMGQWLAGQGVQIEEDEEGSEVASQADGNGAAVHGDDSPADSGRADIERRDMDVKMKPPPSRSTTRGSKGTKRKVQEDEDDRVPKQARTEADTKPPTTRTTRSLRSRK